MFGISSAVEISRDDKFQVEIRINFLFEDYKR